MAEKYYLDEAGLTRLVEFIRQQIKPQQNAIELLTKSDGTPGSIKKTIEDVISGLDVADLQQEEPIRIYGGSASEVLPEEVNGE